MKTKKQYELVLIGPLPPPETGQSVSFEMLHKELAGKPIKINVVNLSRGQYVTKPGYSFPRALEVIKIIFRALFYISLKPSALYLTIAQSLSGFLRDAIIIHSAGLLGVRVIVHLKGGNYDGFYKTQSRLTQWLIRKTLIKVDRILVLGENLRGMYNFDPLLADRIHVVANGLPIDIEPTTKDLPINSDLTPIKLLFLSNLIQSKGYMFILDSVKLLKENYNVELECIFAGRFLSSSDDEEALTPCECEARFRKKVKDHDLENVVRYIGPVSGSKKWRLLREAHIFLLPTKYVNEGQPVSIIEAMAHGCVVITTNFRAIPDLVVDKTTGFFIDYGSSEQIAEITFKLATDKELFAKMSKEAADRYQMLFTRQAHTERIIPHLLDNAP